MYMTLPVFIDAINYLNLKISTFYNFHAQKNSEKYHQYRCHNNDGNFGDVTQVNFAEVVVIKFIHVFWR